MYTQRKLFQKFPRGVVANELDSDIIVSEFELQLRCYAHFWTNTFEESMNPSYPFYKWVK